MKRAIVALSATLSLVFALETGITGCSGRSSASMNPSPGPSPMPGPSGSPTPTPSPGQPTPTPTPGSAAASRFVYAIIDFEASGGFFGGSINPSTGAVTPLTANPFSNTLGQNIVIQVVADRAGRFLYSLNLGAEAGGGPLGQAGINEYQINRASGALQPVPNGDVVFANGRRMGQLAIDGGGRFLYEPNGGGTDIYSIDQMSGLLTFVNTQNTAVPVGTVSAASPDGRFLFNAGANLVEAFSINQTNGDLSLTGPALPSGGTSTAMLVSADSTTLFVANNEGALSLFHIGAGGVLTPIAGSPFAIDPQPEAMSLSPNDRFLYITSGQPSSPSQVKGYSVAVTAGASPSATVMAIAGAIVPNATSISVDGSGKFAYVSLNNQQLGTYAIDPATGALTLMSQTNAPSLTAPWTDDPTDIVVTP